MNKIRVYRITTEDLGDTVIMKPSIPKHYAYGEDISIPRISCAPTIIGCIVGSDIIYRDIDILDKGESTKIYVYSSFVDADRLYQPLSSQVPDQWYTGELWILEDYAFYKINEFIIRKHMDIANSVYSRFSVTGSNSEEVIDRVTGDVIYGDFYSFSFIAFNPLRADSAIEYYEKQMNQII